MIIKYKLINGQIPNNILDGGYFVQGDYLIGKGIDLKHEVLSKEQLILQVLEQHKVLPYIHPSSELILTEQQVIDMVSAWCNQRGE